MLKEEFRLFFKRCVFPALILIAGCTTPQGVPERSGVTFVVADVGQGLSQFIVAENEAVVFDIGPAEAAANWQSTYNSLGRPRIVAIVISHRDLDHSGGLGWIDEKTAWSGLLIASGREDTTMLRKRCLNYKQPITISTVTQGDVIPFVNGCLLDCLWPPPSRSNSDAPVPDDSTNFFSIVCRISHRNCSALITGDIDSTGAREITLCYAEKLRSDIVVVPHHGSAGSVCPLFYGYIRPSYAVLSYGEGNRYGHPSDAATTMLAELGITSISTPANGSAGWNSNGYYWTPRD